MNYMVARRNNVWNDMDRVFDSLFNGAESRIEARVPAVDIVETEKSYEITAELPGFTEEELDIQVKENLLTLTASRPLKTQKKEDKKAEKDEVRYLKRERSQGEFKRSFYLPKDASSENIEAVYANGLLSLILSKVPEAQSVSIKVRTK